MTEPTARSPTNDLTIPDRTRTNMAGLILVSRTVEHQNAALV
jgi:hypothetical protein